MSLEEVGVRLLLCDEPSPVEQVQLFLGIPDGSVECGEGGNTVRQNKQKMKMKDASRA